MDPIWGDCLDKASGSTVMTLSCVPILFKLIINSALALAGTTALVYLIYAGFRYINSGGDAKQIDTARKTATFAIIGLLIILCSFFIVNFIAEVTGVSCIKFFGFDNCK